ncbi:translation initiation factor IF-3 [Klebsiella pneumoniae]
MKSARNAEPPVCRIMDYGKFLYEKSKSSKEQKKKQKVIQVKEIKFALVLMRPISGKTPQPDSLLEDGDKAKITLRFRGREYGPPADRYGSA